jgi:hypothetical protein
MAGKVPDIEVMVQSLEGVAVSLMRRKARRFRSVHKTLR